MAIDQAGDRSKLGRSPHIWSAALTLSILAIALRILVASRREGIEIDGILYLQNARALLTDWRSINAIHPPLYSLLLAPFLPFAKDPEWMGRLVSAVLGGLWVWPTLWLARETTEEDVRWAAGLLIAVMPAAIEASTHVLSEATFGLCLTCFLVLLARTLRTTSWISAALTGALGGLATLARPEGMGYLPLAAALLMLGRPLFGKMWTARTVLGRLALVTLCWCLVLSPFALLIRSQLGYWHWSGKAGVSLLFAEGVGDEEIGSFAERNHVEGHPAPTSVLAYVAARPWSTLRRIVINLHLLDKYVLSGLLTTGGLALAILGFASLRLCRPPGRPEWLLAIAPLPLAGLLLYLVSVRYFVATLPTLSIVAAIGLARLGRHNNSPGASRRFVRGVILLVVVLSFVPWIARPWFRQDTRAVEKAAGLWLRGALPAGGSFLGFYPVIEYYAGSRGMVPGPLSLNDQIAQARRLGAAFFITDNYSLPAFPAGLPTGEAAMLDVSQQLEIVHVSEDRSGRRIFIYRIL